MKTLLTLLTLLTLCPLLSFGQVIKKDTTQQVALILTDTIGSTYTKLVWVEETFELKGTKITSFGKSKIKNGRWVLINNRYWVSEGKNNLFINPKLVLTSFKLKQ